MTHLVDASIACWDCKHFIEQKIDGKKGVRYNLQCKKGYDVCEGKNCKDFEELVSK